MLEELCSDLTKGMVKKSQGGAHDGVIEAKPVFNLKSRHYAVTPFVDFFDCTFQMSLDLVQRGLSYVLNPW